MKMFPQDLFELIHKFDFIRDEEIKNMIQSLYDITDFLEESNKFYRFE